MEAPRTMRIEEDMHTAEFCLLHCFKSLGNPLQLSCWFSVTEDQPMLFLVTLPLPAIVNKMLGSSSHYYEREGMS